MRSRAKKQSRARRSKQDRGFHIFMCVGLVLLCAGSIFTVSVLNKEPPANRYVYTQPEDMWYVDAGEAEIAAVEVTPTPALPDATPEPVVALRAEASGEATAPMLNGASAQEGARALVSGQFKAVAPPTPEPTRAPATITITATGDVTLGTYTDRYGKTSKFRACVEKNGYEYFFEKVRDLLSEDDLTIVNLEGPLTSHSEKRPRRVFNFRGYPEYVNILKAGSVEICNLANNHALDYKEEGFRDTYNVLTEAGIGASGYGPEYYTEVNGYTVGSLGFTEWNFEPADILAAVKAAREKCDLLIVSMHWNKEHHAEFSTYTRKMGRALVDAGADIVIGNHPHIYGAIEKYNGKYIINTLGNFCFGGNDEPGVRECALFRQRFIMQDGQSPEDGGIDIIPAWISSSRSNTYQPFVADVEDGARMLSEILNKHSKKTLNLDEVIWLEDSYIVRNGIIEGAQTQAEPPQAAGDMEIAQDMAI